MKKSTTQVKPKIRINRTYTPPDIEQVRPVAMTRDAKFTGGVPVDLVLPALIKSLKGEIPHVTLRRKFYRIIVGVLEAEGWRGAELYRDLDQAFAQFLDEVHNKR